MMNLLEKPQNQVEEVYCSNEKTKLSELVSIHRWPSTGGKHDSEIVDE
jgi:hypothetical protein